MTGPVASASMAFPDAGANVSSKTGAEAASDDIFGAVLSVLMQPSNAAPADPGQSDAGDSKAADGSGNDALATIDPSLTFAVAQAPWMAQIDIAPQALPAPPVPAATKSADEDAGPNSPSGTMPIAAPPGTSAPGASTNEPLRMGQTLNGAGAVTVDDLRVAVQSDPETLQGQNNSPSSAGAKPTGETSPQPRGTPAPDSETRIARETKRPGDTKQAAGIEDHPVAVATSGNASDPAAAAGSGINENAAVSTAPGASPDVPLVTSGKDEVAIATNTRPEIASAIALANLTQLATRQNPEQVRSRNSSANSPERNSSEALAPAEANDRTQTIRAASAAMPAAPSSNIPHRDIAPGRTDGTADSTAEHPAKNDAVPPTPDDTSRNVAPLPHAAGAEAATAPNPAQGGAQFATLLDRAAADIAPAQALNSAPNATGAPVKLSFPTAAGAPDTPAGLDALAVRIAVHSAGGDKNFTIRLDPPEFGHVEVNLNVNAQGHSSAELRADRPQTLELLQKDASALERALKDAGLSLAGGLTFSLKGEGKSGGWRDSHTPARGRNLQIAPVDAARANAVIAGSAALAANAYGFSTKRLDIRV